MRRERSSRSCCGVESEVDSAAAVLFVPIGNMCARQGQGLVGRDHRAARATNYLSLMGYKQPHNTGCGIEVKGARFLKYYSGKQATLTAVTS